MTSWVDGGVGGTVTMLICGCGLTMVKELVIGVGAVTVGLEGRDERREGNMVDGMQR